MVYKIIISLVLLGGGFWLQSKTAEMKDSKKDLSNVLHLINDETLEDVGSKRLYVSELAKKSYKLNPIRFQSDSIVNICRSYKSLDLLNEKKLYAKYVESIGKLNQLCIDGSPIIPLNQMRTDGNMTDYTLYLSHILSVVENYLTNKLNELILQKDAKKNRWEILTRPDPTRLVIS